jgi:hypothetical protein
MLHNRLFTAGGVARLPRQSSMPPVTGLPLLTVRSLAKTRHLSERREKSREGHATRVTPPRGPVTIDFSRTCLVAKVAVR